MARMLLALAAVALAGVVGWGLFVGLPRWSAPPRAVAVVASAATPEEGGDRRIRATLFYVAEGGANLVGVEREVPYGEGAVEQAQRLIEAQLQPVAAPLTQAIPEGTGLRAVFITDRGEAYVDMSAEISRNHPGGSLEELFTVYAIVNVLTANLPAITSVQILVDGREVETIAGHVDARRPLVKNLSLLAQPAAAGATPPVSPAGQNP